jgi:hypothetical protein
MSLLARHSRDGVGARLPFGARRVKLLIRKIGRAAYLTPSDWQYLTIATFELLAARFRLSTVATEKILRELQSQLSATPQKQESASAKVDIERLSWAIAVVARHAIWRSDCLIQVMAADRWLRRHHLRPDFYLGIAKTEQGIFAAHAWLRYGDITVTGGRSSQFSTLIEPAKKHF